MADEIEKEIIEENEPDEKKQTSRRSLFSLRTIVTVIGIAFASLVVFSAVVFVLYRVGVFDNYIKSQLVTKLSDIGIEFQTESIRVTASPMSLELHNATFRDKVTAEKLFFVRDARLELTVLDLLAWRLSRDIRIDRSDIRGAEIWVKFDENGRSNFSNLKFIEDQTGSAVNFRYDSVVFSLQDSIVHFGDVSRAISADAANLTFYLEPATDTNADVPRFKFDLKADDANLTYDQKVLDKISLQARGVADRFGADISGLSLRTPVGDSSLIGTLRDWASPKYELDIESSLDITQISNIFGGATPLRGAGNFKGHVSGTGENYRIQGTADSEALRAGGVYLKALNVAATVNGTNANYDANGKAVAEMLTFEDFQVDFPKLVGNVRGTGTDFRWVGELEAIALRSPTMTLGGLFLSDALAEYKDQQFKATVGNGRARRFAAGDIEFEDLRARNLSFAVPSGGGINISAPNATASSLVSKDYRLDEVAGRNVRIKHVTGSTTVDAEGLTSGTAKFGQNVVRGVSASEFKLKDEGGIVGLIATNLKARQVDSNGIRIDGLESPLASLDDKGGVTTIYSDKTRVAKIDTGSAVLGSLNIAGVRMTIRRGTIEGTSGDIDAGDVAISQTKQIPGGGGLQAVKFGRPVFIVEPSGRYRASADMSIGGGTIGSVSLGSASAKVEINNDRVLLEEITAKVMDGDVSGSAEYAFNDRSQSRIDADFRDLDLSKLAAVQSGRVMPLSGKTTGDAHLVFQGSDYRTTSGTLNFDVTATAGTAERGLVPINGNVQLTADKGLFEVAKARLFTEKSELTAGGRFDLRNNDSNLNLAIKSDDASEIRRIVGVTGISPDLDTQMTNMEAEFGGGLRFDGMVTGDLLDPVVNGHFSVDTIMLRQRVVGSVSLDITRNPAEIILANGELKEPGGGTAEFASTIPYGGKDNITVTATLNGVNAANLLAALPISLPERIRDLDGRTSGSVKITGLPNNAEGEVDLLAAKGTIAGQSFDELKANAVFHGTRIELDPVSMKVGDGSLTAKGFFDRRSTEFEAELSGKSIPLPLLMAVFPANNSIPEINGLVDLTAKAVGKSNLASSIDVSFEGVSRETTVGDSPLGEVNLSGRTKDQVLSADLVGSFEGRPQIVKAMVNLADDNLPFSVTTSFDRSPLSPFIAFIPQLKGVPITGTGTGKIEFGGNLRAKNDKGESIFDASSLAGTATFSQLDLNIQDTPLGAVEPIVIRFSPREVNFDNAKFAGGGSNMTISGTKGIVDDAENNLEINGKVNLSLLNLAKTDVFFAGVADVAVRLNGPNKVSRLTGTATSDNATVATFIGSDRLTFERVKARVIFTSNQAEVEEATGYLGGGKFNGSGGLLLDGLAVRSFRFTVFGDNVTVPLPKDFLTTGDATLEISGQRPDISNNLQVTIAGRVFAKRSLYTKDIELANIVGARRETSLSSSTSSISAPRYDLVIEGRNALVVRNNIADLTASVSLNLTGDADNPRLSGRITANSGTLLYRKDRYDIQRAVLEFPPETTIEPIINLQAETEISGYQIFVNLSGPLNDTERLVATVRSSPALPSTDVVSLITTGSLANTAGGIPALAQTGLNTAAEILTDSIINNPARKATDKLFGLNVFEIDPIISGQQLNPSARLTVGRQINNNLKVTYSTNLSQDQNQVIALEYRVSNKLSVVAQYEQRSLSNVTRNRDNFSVEIRFRKRF